MPSKMIYPCQVSTIHPINGDQDRQQQRQQRQQQQQQQQQRQSNLFLHLVNGEYFTRREPIDIINDALKLLAAAAPTEVPDCNGQCGSYQEYQRQQ